MPACRAYLDILTPHVDMICCWLDIHHLACDDRRYRRTATCSAQTLLVLLWLIDAIQVHSLAYGRDQSSHRLSVRSRSA